MPVSNTNLTFVNRPACTCTRRTLARGLIPTPVDTVIVYQEGASAKRNRPLTSVRPRAATEERGDETRRTTTSAPGTGLEHGVSAMQTGVVGPRTTRIWTPLVTVAPPVPADAQRAASTAAVMSSGFTPSVSRRVVSDLLDEGRLSRPRLV